MLLLGEEKEQDLKSQGVGVKRGMQVCTVGAAPGCPVLPG